MLPPDLLEEMRAEYVQNLRARLVRIESLWREMGSDGQAREELLRIVHLIAGSAGTFGLPAVGEAAFELESQLQEGCATEAAIRRLLEVART